MNTQQEAAAATPKGAEAVALGQRIQDRRGPMLRRDLAYRVGVHENTFGKWERGETVPDVLQLLTIASVLEVPVLDFLTPQRAAEDRAEYRTGEAFRSTQPVRRGDYLYVPLFDLQTARRASALGDVEQVREMLPFVAQYVASELRIGHQSLVAVRMVGLVAEPDIQPGDQLLIDLQDCEVETDGPHLVRVDQTLAIKTLHRKPGRILVSNGRDDTGAFEVPHTADENFEVMGRCRWVGTRLR